MQIMWNLLVNNNAQVSIWLLFHDFKVIISFMIPRPSPYIDTWQFFFFISLNSFPWPNVLRYLHNIFELNTQLVFGGYSCFGLRIIPLCTLAGKMGGHHCPLLLYRLKVKFFKIVNLKIIWIYFIFIWIFFSVIFINFIK